MTEEPIPASCHLTSIQSLWSMCTHMYTHTHTSFEPRMRQRCVTLPQYLEKPSKPWFTLAGRTRRLTDMRINVCRPNLATQAWQTAELSIISHQPPWGCLKYPLLQDRRTQRKHTSNSSWFLLNAKLNNKRHLKGQKVNFIDCRSYHETPIRNNYKIMWVFFKHTFSIIPTWWSFHRKDYLQLT